MGQLYVYCPRGSTGAFELAKELGAERVRKFDGLNFYNKAGKKFNPETGSGIVCWGTVLPEVDGLKVLNALEHWVDKKKEHEILENAQVPTVQVTVRAAWSSRASYLKAGWLPRSRTHTGGVDLLGIEPAEDFWVKKETFTNEYRIHSFGGKSIRAGRKVLREGFTVAAEADWKPNTTLAHPWVRSWDGGWKMSYADFRSTNPMRTIAHKAVKALGLHFGAVDIGETAPGKFKVLEVNTAPGIEGGTLKAYGRAIKTWYEGGSVEGVE